MRPFCHIRRPHADAALGTLENLVAILQTAAFLAKSAIPG